MTRKIKLITVYKFILELQIINSKVTLDPNVGPILFIASYKVECCPHLGFVHMYFLFSHSDQWTPLWHLVTLVGTVIFSRDLSK